MQPLHSTEPQLPCQVHSPMPSSCATTTQRLQTVPSQLRIHSHYSAPSASTMPGKSQAVRFSHTVTVHVFNKASPPSRQQFSSTGPPNASFTTTVATAQRLYCAFAHRATRAADLQNVSVIHRRLAISTAVRADHTRLAIPSPISAARKPSHHCCQASIALPASFALQLDSSPYNPLFEPSLFETPP